MSCSFKMFSAFAVAILLGAAVAAQTTGAASQALPAVQRAAPITAPVSQQPGGQPDAVRVAAPVDMRIGAGDLLEVSVYGAPDFDKKEVRVSGAGEVVLPLVGPQHVEGMTVEQAQALISKKLAAGQYFNDPQVSVFVKEYATQGVSVLGEVQKPGVYPLLGRRKLFDAISLAGGLTPKAGKSVTITHRNDPNHPENVRLGRRRASFHRRKCGRAAGRYGFGSEGRHCIRRGRCQIARRIRYGTGQYLGLAGAGPGAGRQQYRCSELRQADSQQQWRAKGNEYSSQANHDGQGTGSVASAG